MTTTAVMTLNVTENVRRQRKIVLPVSFAMFLVATVVRAHVPHVHVYLLTAIAILAPCRYLDPGRVWIPRSKGRQYFSVLRRYRRSNECCQNVLLVPPVGTGGLCNGE